MILNDYDNDHELNHMLWAYLGVESVFWNKVSTNSQSCHDFLHALSAIQCLVSSKDQMDQLRSLVGKLHRAARELHLETLTSDLGALGDLALSAPSMGSVGSFGSRPSRPHWSDLPTFVVNLDRSPHRQQTVTSTVVGYGWIHPTAC